MKISDTELKEVKIIEYAEEYDNRGMSYYNYSRRELELIGVSFDLLEAKVYSPKKAGTLYGIHFQNNPKAQSKLLYCVQGKGLDYAIDLRRDSHTYLKWVSVELSAADRKQIFIPKGFGHIFLSLEDDTKVVMCIDEYFDSRYSRQIAWDDKMIGIKYPIEVSILAPHDIKAPSLMDSDFAMERDIILRKYKPKDCVIMAELFYETVHTVNVSDYTSEQLDAWATGDMDWKCGTDLF